MLEYELKYKLCTVNIWGAVGTIYNKSQYCDDSHDFFHEIKRHTVGT